MFRDVAVVALFRLKLGFENLAVVFGSIKVHYEFYNWLREDFVEV